MHDCFSVTELVTMEDLHISPEGGAIKDVLDGFYDADGKVPCQIDGGLKCFGHPIGASGLRMIYEMYLQMQGRAGERQRKDEPRFGLTHNLGGFPQRERVAPSPSSASTGRNVIPARAAAAAQAPLPLGRGQGWGTRPEMLAFERPSP